jgi:hypothetical protein
MLGEMSAADLGGWVAFFGLEPWGALRDDLRFGQLGAAVVNNIPLRGKSPQVVTPGDFFATLRVEPKRQSAAGMEAAARAIVAAFGGTANKAGGDGEARD